MLNIVEWANIVFESNALLLMVREASLQRLLAPLKAVMAREVLIDVEDQRMEKLGKVDAHVTVLEYVARMNDVQVQEKLHGYGWMWNGEKWLKAV